MKIAINNNGEYVEVSNDTIVNTVNGIHYLLSPEQQIEYDNKIIIWDSGIINRANQDSTSKRHAAYSAESDPIFFKFQRNEVTKQDWLDKIAEIKLRFPRTDN